MNYGNKNVLNIWYYLEFKDLKGFLLNQKSTDSTRVEQELEEYEESNNPIIGFFKEISEEEVDNEPTKNIYKQY